MGLYFATRLKVFLKELEKFINILTPLLDFLLYLGAVSCISWSNDS